MSFVQQNKKSIKMSCAFFKNTLVITHNSKVIILKKILYSIFKYVFNAGTLTKYTIYIIMILYYLPTLNDRYY